MDFVDLDRGLFRGYSRDLRYSEGWTDLHIAAERGNEERLASAILEDPESIAAVTVDGVSVLHCAAVRGQERVVAQLLAHRPELVAMETTQGIFALHFAAHEGHAGVVAQLLASRPDLIDAVAGGWTALHCAAFGGHPEVATQLLILGPELIDARSANSGKTALECAVFHGKGRVAEVLLDFKPEQARHIDNIGGTLLHKLMREGKLFSQTFVEKLWSANPDALHLADNGSQTPLQIAVTHNNWEGVELLKWHCSLDELESAFKQQKRNVHWLDDVILSQCEPLQLLLNRDVILVVHAFLDIQYVKPL